jgi:phage-related protein
MIEERFVMTARENVHQLIDALPEERLADVRDYIADLQDGDTHLDPETATAVKEGLDDIRNSRTISLADYRRTRGL